MSPKKPRVVYWNNMPAPYIVERFNALVDRGNFYFEAWFNERRQADRSWDVDESAWRFQYRYLPAVRIGRHRILFPLPIFSRNRPDVLVGHYSKPAFFIGWIIARLRGIKTIFRTVMTFDRWVHRRRWKEILKRYAFGKVDGVETPGPDARDFALRYGADPRGIFYATHAINVTHFQKGCELTLSGRELIHKEFGLTGVTFIYVGRLWWGKGVYCLLDAFCQLQRRLEEEISLLLVGDGEDERSLKERSEKENIRNVIFAGFHQKQDLPRYYAAADVFVFPTLGDPYGLVVDEAMACSLPVISTSAAGEIRDRIEDGVNGYIVPPEDSNAFSERMEILARDAELRKKMGVTSAKKIAGHTPERWAEDFEKAVFTILGKRKDAL